MKIVSPCHDVEVISPPGGSYGGAPMVVCPVCGRQWILEFRDAQKEAAKILSGVDKIDKIELSKDFDMISYEIDNVSDKDTRYILIKILEILRLMNG